MEKERELLHELNVLKGIAIIFVVLIHICGPFQYESIKKLINHFQSFMYLFMFASGFLFNYTGRKILSFSDYRDLVKNKFRYLLIPYFSTSLALLAIKYLTGIFVTLKNPVGHAFWKDILLAPMGGFATHLWFIYVLFIIFLIFPILRLVNNLFLIIMTALAIYFIKIPDNYYFDLYLVRFYLVFFCIGYMYSEINYTGIYRKAWVLWSIFTVISIILFKNSILINDGLQLYMSYFYADNVYLMLNGVSCIFTFYYVSVLISQRKNILFKILNYLGVNSFIIYLFHTICMGSFCFLSHKFKVDKLYVTIMLTLVGLFMPIICLKYCIGKNKILSLLFIGKDMTALKV